MRFCCRGSLKEVTKFAVCSCNENTVQRGRIIRTKRIFTKLAGVAVALAGIHAYAHHSFAQFAMDKQTTIQGTVKSFQWTNPHSWIELSVVNKDGAVESWNIEGGGPNILSRFGWTRKSLQPGDKVTLVINPLRDGQPGGALNYVVLADGTHLDQGQSKLPKGAFGEGQTGAPKPADGAVAPGVPK